MLERGKSLRLGLASDGSAYARRCRACVEGVFADQVRIVDLVAEAPDALDAVVVLGERFEAPVLQELLLGAIPPRRLVVAFEKLEELEQTALSELEVRTVRSAASEEVPEQLVTEVRGALLSVEGGTDPGRVHEVLGQLSMQSVGALNGLLFKRRLSERRLEGPSATGLDVLDVAAGASAGSEALSFGGSVGAEVRVVHATAAGLSRLDSIGSALFTQELLAVAMKESSLGLDFFDCFLSHAAARLGNDETYAPNLLVLSPRLRSMKCLLTDGADLWIVNGRRIPRVTTLSSPGGRLRGRGRTSPFVTRSLPLAGGDVFGLLPALAAAPGLSSGRSERRASREEAFLRGLKQGDPVPAVERDLADGEVRRPGVIVRWSEPGQAGEPAGGEP